MLGVQHDSKATGATVDFRRARQFLLALLSRDTRLDHDALSFRQCFDSLLLFTIEQTFSLSESIEYSSFFIPQWLRHRYRSSHRRCRPFDVVDEICRCVDDVVAKSYTLVVFNRWKSLLPVSSHTHPHNCRRCDRRELSSQRQSSSSDTHHHSHTCSGRDFSSDAEAKGMHFYEPPAMLSSSSSSSPMSSSSSSSSSSGVICHRPRGYCRRKHHRRPVRTLDAIDNDVDVKLKVAIVDTSKRVTPATRFQYVDILIDSGGMIHCLPRALVPTAFTFRCRPLRIRGAGGERIEHLGCGSL